MSDNTSCLVFPDSDLITSNMYPWGQLVHAYFVGNPELLNRKSNVTEECADYIAENHVPVPESKIMQNYIQETRRHERLFKLSGICFPDGDPESEVEHEHPSVPVDYNEDDKDGDKPEDASHFRSKIAQIGESMEPAVDRLDSVVIGEFADKEMLVDRKIALSAEYDPVTKEFNRVEQIVANGKAALD